MENPTFDQEELRIYGVTSDNNEKFLGTIKSLDTSISDIDATKYPFLKVQMYTKDDTNRTPTQLKYLRIQYAPYPELAINPLKH